MNFFQMGKCADSKLSVDLGLALVRGLQVNIDFLGALDRRTKVFEFRKI